MNLTIKSRTYGPITFSRPGSYYIYADLNGKSGTLGTQICAGGTTMGGTLGYSGDDEKAFAAICRRWYRASKRTD